MRLRRISPVVPLVLVSSCVSALGGAFATHALFPAPRGSQGLAGIQGPPGPAGPRGIPGAVGADGRDGKSATAAACQILFFPETFPNDATVVTNADKYGLGPAYASLSLSCP